MDKRVTIQRDTNLVGPSPQVKTFPQVTVSSLTAPRLRALRAYTHDPETPVPRTPVPVTRVM